MEQILSTRECAVLELIARSCKNREIALALEIEEVTVRFHIRKIFNKLGVRSRIEVVCYAFRNGWIT